VAATHASNLDGLAAHFSLSKGYFSYLSNTIKNTAHSWYLVI